MSSLRPFGTLRVSPDLETRCLVGRDPWTESPVGVVTESSLVTSRIDIGKWFLLTDFGIGMGPFRLLISTRKVVLPTGTESNPVFNFIV